LFNDGGSAFPVPGSEPGAMLYLGMTLRDWFAGQALRMWQIDKEDLRNLLAGAPPTEEEEVGDEISYQIE